MGNFDAHKWFKKQYLGEGHTEDKMERDMEARKRSRLSPDELKKLDAMRAFYRGETDVLPTDLKENMTPGEAVTELNFLMDELQNISGEVKQIMRQTFPDEYRRGDAYGAFDFGTSGNRFDTTFEGILDDLDEIRSPQTDFTRSQLVPRMEGMVDRETYKRFTDSLEDLLDDWYMEGFEKDDVLAFMKVIIPSN